MASIEMVHSSRVTFNLVYQSFHILPLRKGGRQLLLDSPATTNYDNQNIMMINKILRRDSNILIQWCHHMPPTIVALSLHNKAGNCVHIFIHQPQFEAYLCSRIHMKMLPVGVEMSPPPPVCRQLSPSRCFDCQEHNHYTGCVFKCCLILLILSMQELSSGDRFQFFNQIKNDK